MFKAAVSTVKPSAQVVPLATTFGDLDNAPLQITVFTSSISARTLIFLDPVDAYPTLCPGEIRWQRHSPYNSKGRVGIVSTKRSLRPWRAFLLCSRYTMSGLLMSRVSSVFCVKLLAGPAGTEFFSETRELFSSVDHSEQRTGK